jgi:hypothetical protein
MHTLVSGRVTRVQPLHICTAAAESAPAAAFMLLPQALDGPGGAISLHAVSSKVDLASCTLLDNAAREGGALYIRSTSTAVNLSMCTAAGNKAFGGTPANASFEEYASHHGGALSMSGSASELTLKACSFQANKAQGQVGVTSAPASFHCSSGARNF